VPNGDRNDPTDLCRIDNAGILFPGTILGEVIMRRTFQHGKEQLWSIERLGVELTVRWGRRGGKEQVRSRKLDNEHRAEQDLRRQIKKKVGDGYKETTPKGKMPPLGPMGDALVGALAEQPSDLSAHMAFADWLSEQPEAKLQTWGEFVRVQLQLEDTNLRPKVRKGLAQRETELRDAYQRDWLGEALACHLLQLRPGYLPEYMRDFIGVYQWSYARGWLDTLTLGYLNAKLVSTLAASPSLRLLRKLQIHDHPIPGPDLTELVGSPNLANVRVLHVVHHGLRGFSTFVGSFLKLEELRAESYAENFRWVPRLPNLASLRVLEMRGEGPYPLKALADNPATANLRRLALNAFDDEGDPDDDAGPLDLHELAPLFQPGTFPGLRDLHISFCPEGTELCRQVVRSGLLKRLDVLNLSANDLHQDGAEVLAACPDLPRLKSLVLNFNGLDAGSLRLLRETGVTLTARHQGDWWFFDDYENFDEDFE
jgi:uncharacterized protein (TIGR02996 family)